MLGPSTAALEAKVASAALKDEGTLAGLARLCGARPNPVTARRAHLLDGVHRRRAAKVAVARPCAQPHAGAGTPKLPSALPDSKRSWGQCARAPGRGKVNAALW